MSKKLLLGSFLSIAVIVMVFTTKTYAFWPFDGWKSKGEVKAATTDQNSRRSLFDRLRSKTSSDEKPANYKGLEQVYWDSSCEMGKANDPNCDKNAFTANLEDKINKDTNNKLVLSSPTNSKLDVMAKMCARDPENSKLNSVFSKWLEKKSASLGFSSKSKYSIISDFRSMESEFESICSQIMVLDKKVDAFEGNYKNWMTHVSTSSGKMPVPTRDAANCTYQQVQCFKAPCPEIAICNTPTAVQKY